MANVFRSILLRLQNKSVPATTSNNPVTADAGYDGLGTVTITPQQHSETYTPSANTAANDMGAVHNKRYVNTSGMIVPSGNKAITSNGTGIDVSSYSTASVSVSGTPITPSDSNPPAMTSGIMYTPSANGYAYASQITPASKTETTLWTNSTPTSTFSAQAVTLSQSIDNFDYIKIKHASVRNQTTNNSFLMETIYSKEDVRKCKNSSSTVQMALCGKIGSDRAIARHIWYVSDTELNISDVKYIGGSWSLDNSQEIPISIVGIKYTGV